jgi:hypothetical protein
MSDWLFLSRLLLTNVAATLFLAGILWSLQIVQFPLMLSAQSGDFVAYVRAQRTRNTLLMTLPMLVEAATGGWLLTTPIPSRHLLTAMVLLVIGWIVTLGLIVPMHARIMRGYDPHAIRVLIRTNWIRTFCWTARACLMIWITLIWIRSVRLRIY